MRFSPSRDSAAKGGSWKIASWVFGTLALACCTEDWRFYCRAMQEILQTGPPMMAGNFGSRTLTLRLGMYAEEFFQSTPAAPHYAMHMSSVNFSSPDSLDARRTLLEMGVEQFTKLQHQDAARLPGKVKHDNDGWLQSTPIDQDSSNLLTLPLPRECKLRFRQSQYQFL